MRWKLLRRRLSLSAPRVIVRSRLPWPARWAVVAAALGFSAAIALWAFEFGKEIAGVDRVSRQELQRLRAEIQTLRAQRDSAQSVANTAESLLTAERATLDRLTAQIRQLEGESQGLKADLGFFERLLPVDGEGLQVRGLQVESTLPGQTRYQILVMQSGRDGREFRGSFELMLAGLLGGKPWSQPLPGGARPLQVRQYARVEGLVDHPAEVVLQSVRATVRDDSGAVRATQTVTLPR